MKIGNIDVQPSSARTTSRLSLLLWGDAGIGKTTLACTAPGKKLLINLDPEGPAAVTYRGDVDVLDLSSLSTDDVLLKLKSDNNPLGLDAVFKEEKPASAYSSIILDSLTALSARALEDVVKRGVGKSKRDAFQPTMETPGLGAYGGRNAVVLTCVKGLLRVTGRYSKHIIFISHESDPEKDTQGNVLYITMQLGGKLVTAMSQQISEVLWLHEASGKPSIAIRPCRSRKPMKTRMFNTSGPAEFPLLYDYEKWKEAAQNPLTKWWKAWETGKGNKLALPK